MPSAGSDKTPQRIVDNSGTPLWPRSISIDYLILCTKCILTILIDCSTWPLLWTSFAGIFKFVCTQLGQLLCLQQMPLGEPPEALSFPAQGVNQRIPTISTGWSVHSRSHLRESLVLSGSPACKVPVCCFAMWLARSSVNPLVCRQSGTSSMQRLASELLDQTGNYSLSMLGVNTGTTLIFSYITTANIG